MIKSIKERRTEWREEWIKKNIPEGVRYNPFLHKRIPVVPNLAKLIRYANKLIKDGLDNETINGRLLKYRKTQLTDYDLDYLRLYYYEIEKIEKDPKLKMQIENLEKNIKELIEEKHEIHNDYLWNVQSPYLKIEKQIVKDHKHEYLEYMKLMKEKSKYLFRDNYVLRGDGGELTREEYYFYMYNIQSPYLNIEEQMVREHKHVYSAYMKFMEQKVEYKENMVEIGTVIDDSKEAINKIENDIYRRVREGYKKIEDWRNEKHYN